MAIDVTDRAVTEASRDRNNLNPLHQSHHELPPSFQFHHQRPPIKRRYETRLEIARLQIFFSFFSYL